MTSHDAQLLSPKLLDAYVREIRALTSSERLRSYAAMHLPNGAMDAHASAYARAYRMRGEDGSFACLRFWLNTDPTPLIETYTALERSPEVLTRCGLSRLQLFTEAIVVDEQAIPAVLMDWVEGGTLGDVVSARLGSSSELRRIAEALRSTFVSLNHQRTSHGDLRASNIIAALDGRSVRIGLIDLDSLRWYGGPASPRVLGGNRLWDGIRQRENVPQLASDYLDQAMAYLTLIAVATERSWWPGSTDDFLTLKHLRVDSEEALRRLEKMRGAPGRVAGAVRRTLEEPGHWSGIADVMRDPTGEPLEAAKFWDMVMERRCAPTKTEREEVQSTAPVQEPAKEGRATPRAFSRRARRLPWLWILVVIGTMAVTALIIYWLKQS